MKAKRNHSMNQTILHSMDFGEFNTKPEKCEQMAILCATAYVPICACEHLISNWRPLLWWRSRLITLQILHLSVHQPELMDLSADRQTTCCQLCSVQLDNTRQCTSGLFPEMDDWIARLIAEEICVCVLVCMRFCLVWLFVHFCVCPSNCGLFFHCWQWR